MSVNGVAVVCWSLVMFDLIVADSQVLYAYDDSTAG